MLRFSLILLMIPYLICSCKLTNSAKPTKITQKKAKETLAPPNIEISFQEIAGISLPRFAFSAKFEPHHYQYELCKTGVFASCEKGFLFWGAKLDPNLSHGEHTLKAKSCSRSPLKGSYSCSEESSVSFIQKNNNDQPHLSLIMKQQELSNAIRQKAYSAHSLIKSYFDEQKEQLKDAKPFDLMVVRHLGLGPHALGALVNTHAYLSYHESLNRPDQPKASEKPPANKQTTEHKADKQENTDQMQQVLDRLEKLEQKPTESHAKGMLLMSLSTTSVLTGLLTITLSAIGMSSSRTLIKDVEETLAEKIQNFSVTLSGGKTQTIESATITTSLEQLEKGFEEFKKEIDSYISILDRGFNEAKVTDLLDLVGRKVRTLNHNPLRYVVNMRPEDIADGKLMTSSHRYGEFLDIKGYEYTILQGRHQINARYIKFDKKNHTQVFRFIEEYDPKLKSKLESALMEQKLSSISNGLHNTSDSIEKNTFAFEGYQYSKIGEQWYRQDIVYQVQGEAVFQEINGKAADLPELVDNFPKLHDKTIEALSKRIAILARKDAQTSIIKKRYGISDDPGDLWGKGVPLFDVEGRLVEPPEYWKSQGHNWFSQSNSWFPKNINPIDDNGEAYKGQGGKPLLFVKEDLNKKDLVMRKTPEARVGSSNPLSIYSRYIDPKIEVKLWTVEHSIRDLEKKANLQVDDIRSQGSAQTDSIKASLKNMSSYVDTQISQLKQGVPPSGGDKEIKSLQQNFDDFRLTNDFWLKAGMGMGAILFTAGAVGILHQFGYGLSTLPHQEILMSKLAKLELDIYELHKNKITLLFELKKILEQEEKYEPATDHWIYEL